MYIVALVVKSWLLLLTSNVTLVAPALVGDRQRKSSFDPYVPRVRPTVPKRQYNSCVFRNDVPVTVTTDAPEVGPVVGQMLRTDSGANNDQWRQQHSIHTIISKLETEVGEVQSIICNFQGDKLLLLRR